MAKAKYTYNKTRKEWNTKIWDGTYTEDGRKHRLTIVSKKSSKDLEDKVAAFKLSVSDRQNVRFTSMTFGEYAEHWLSTAKATAAKNTVIMYRNVIDVHLHFLHFIPLTEIQHSHFVQAISFAKTKPRTCEQIYITFRQIMRYAAQDRLITPNDLELIIENVSLPEKPEHEKRPLTPIEKEAIKTAAFSPREKLFISILYSCGFRREEIMALTPSDFDFAAKTISINKVVIYDGNTPEIKPSPKSKRGLRKVPYPSMAEFRDQILSSKVYLFGVDGRLMTKSGYDGFWQRILNKINLAAGGQNQYFKSKKKTLIVDNAVPGLTAHIFRHNYCTELCYQVPKISIKKIAYLMGDTEKMVLSVYNHISEERENAEAVISDVFQL